jgi:hypothetical protein
MVFKWLAGALSALCLCHGASAQITSAAMEEPVARVVAMVSELWDKTKPEYRKGLWERDLKDLKGAPASYDDFVAAEQWLVVVSNRSYVYPGIFKGRAMTSDNVAYGDIVEMKVLSGYKSPKIYDDLGLVLKVLCRRAQADYAQCAKDNPLAWFGQDGRPLVQPKP